MDTGPDPLRRALPRNAREAVEPAAVAATVVVLSLFHPAGFGLIALVASAVGTILAAARLRGRISIFDAALVFAWLHGGWPAALLRGDGLRLAAWTAAASVAAINVIRLIDARSPEPAPSSSRPWFWSAFAVVLGLSILKFPAGPGMPELDASWKRSLVYFLQHDLQAGVDWVFTMGPLGCFHQGTTASGLFGAMILWQLATCAVAAGFVTALLRDLPSRPAQAIAAGLSLLLLPLHADGIAIIGIAAFALHALRAPGGKAGPLLAGMLFLILIFWTKFNLGLLAVVSAGTVALSRRRSPIAAASLSLVFIAGLMAAWCACGQRFSSLGPYLKHSVTLASAYSEAMPQSVTRSLVGPGIAAFLFAAGILAWSGASRPIDKDRALGAIAGLVALFFAWKSGFVREDPYHTVIFFPVAALLPWFVAEPAAGRRAFGIARFATVLPCLLWIFVSRTIWPFPFAVSDAVRPIRNAATLLSAGKMRAEHEKAGQEIARRCDLPAVRAQVGSGSVDILSSEQELVLLNGFTWTPRPVFQSYVAYEESSARLNADFFESARAPEYVLYKPEGIDGRLPAPEDGLSLQTIYREYRPVLVEKSYLLLRRAPASASRARAGRVLLDREIDWGETVDLRPLGRSVRTLSLDLRPTMVGAVARTLFRTPPVFVEIVDSEGASSKYRVIPATARLGFLADPLLAAPNDLVAWSRGDQGRSIASVRVLPDEAPRRCFGPRIRILVVEADR